MSMELQGMLIEINEAHGKKNVGFELSIFNHEFVYRTSGLLCGSILKATIQRLV